MPTATRPLVWFERPVLPSLVATVEAACTPIGPGTDEDRYAGIEPAVAAVVGASPYDGAVMDRAPRLRVRLCRPDATNL